MTILTANTKRLWSLYSCYNVVRLKIKYVNIKVNLSLKCTHLYDL